MRVFRILCLLIIIVVLVVPTAQPATAADPICESASLYAQAAKLKSSGDAKQDLTDLTAFADAIHQANIVCNGFKFEGKGGKAVGPVNLPTGTWLLTATTKEFLITKARVLSGECGSNGRDINQRSIFNLSPGEGSEGAAIIIDSKDCRVIFTLSNIDDSWVFTFEPLS